MHKLNSQLEKITREKHCITSIRPIFYLAAAFIFNVCLKKSVMGTCRETSDKKRGLVRKGLLNKIMARWLHLLQRERTLSYIYRCGRMCQRGCASSMPGVVAPDRSFSWCNRCKYLS